MKKGFSHLVDINCKLDDNVDVVFGCLQYNKHLSPSSGDIVGKSSPEWFKNNNLIFRISNANI